MKHVLSHSWEHSVVSVSGSQQISGGRERFLVYFLTQTLPLPRLCAGDQIFCQDKRQR